MPVSNARGSKIKELPRYTKIISLGEFTDDEIFSNFELMRVVKGHWYLNRVHRINSWEDLETRFGIPTEIILLLKLKYGTLRDDRNFKW